MKKSLFRFFIICVITSFAQLVFAQAPNINYSPTSNTYTTGTAISTWSPTNSGGAVSASFTEVTTLVPTTGALNSPYGLTTDGSGNIYEADFGGNCIYMITPTGTVTKIAGSGTASEVDNTTGTSATFNGPAGIVYDGSAFLYVTDFTGNKVRRISTTSPYAVVTIAGTGAAAETDNTTGTSAKFNNPGGIDIGSGLLYVADYTGCTIRTVSLTSPYAVVTIAGKSTLATEVNANGTAARFDNPGGVTYDGSSFLYVCDVSGNTIRKVGTTGLFTVTTFAGSTTAGSTNGTGTAARFTNPTFCSFDPSGNLIVADGGNNLIRKITTGAVVTTLAGNGTKAELDGSGTSAEFFAPFGITVDDWGNIYVGDANGTSSTLRKITTTGYSITGPLPTGLSFDTSTGNITGTPTGTSAATNYTVTAYNASGSSSKTITITINPSAPTTTNGTSCGATSVTLTASGSLPAGGTYTWYAAATGGTALATGSTYSPSPASTTTYYVSYTSGGLTTARVAATATIASPAVISTAPTTGGLYLSYSFSGNANDISGNGNNGTVQGGAALTSDRYGNANSAYSFNGSSQYISTTKAVAAPGPLNFSISCWFKTSTAGGMLVGYSASQTGAGSQYDRHIYMTNTGALYFGVYVTSTGTATTINTTTTYADGNWHHVVATCSSTNGSYLYVDGALQASSATMTTPETYTGNGYWRVGYNTLSGWPNAPTDLYFTGSLDDVAVYTSAISASQVYTLYGAGSSPACANSALSLQVNTVAGATYSWSGPNSFSSTSQNPTVSASATTAMAGTYTCTVTTTGGCTSTISVTAVVNAAPVSTFTATTPVNLGSTSTITYSGTYSATSTYTWSFNGGTTVSGSGVGPYVISWSTAGSYTVSLTVTNSSGCSSTSTQTVVVGSYGNYAFSDPITLNTTSLGITSNLTNFPALLSIQDNNLIISGACTDKVYYPNGPNYDFAFYDPSTSAELPYQIVSYSQTTGTLLVWVQIPTLTYASNKTIEFYYGSASPPTTHNTAFYESTWGSDYKGVFHFDDASYSGTTPDATTSGNAGTASGMTSTNLVTGKIGSAYSFNGSSTKFTFSPITVTGTFTISAWIKLGATGNDQKIMTNQGAAGGGTGGYKLGVYSTNEAECESGTSVDRGSSPTPPTLAAGVWHYVQGVYSGTTLSTYVDGSQYAVLNTTNNPSSTTAYYIGVGEGGTQFWFNGTIDEARVSNVAKTGDWIKAEYIDQGNPVSFTTVGSTAVNTTNAATLNGMLTYTWTGATSTDPTVAGNWTNTTAGVSSQAPALTGTATLIIPSGLTNYPSLTANASLYGLTIQSGASLNLNGYTLSVACNIYNSATGQILYGSNSTSGITWNGSATAQTYTGSSTTNTAELGNMTINNSSGGTVTISGGPVDIYNTLTITKGNLAVGASPAALTIKSTATLTGSVAAIPSGYSITGTVSVERYITGGSGYRGYRLISSPVYAATVSSNNIYSINYLQTYTVLTGNAGGGFDKTGNPTLYLFREDKVPSNATFTSGNFWGISAINNATSYNYYMNGGSTVYNIPIGNGMMFFFRGNRASATVAAETTASYVPVTVTTVTSGTLNQGQVVVHDWYTPSSANLGFTGSGTGPTTNGAVRGFNLVGNPYASSIDWQTYNTSSTTTGIYANNVGNTVYELNPKTNNYDTYQVGGAFTNHGSNVIASGQGFFVEAANSTSPQLIFNESAKTSAQNTGLNLFMAKRAALASLNNVNLAPHLRLQVAADSVNTDDTYIGFNTSANPNFDMNEDAEYRKGNGIVSIASYSGDKVQLAINKTQLPGAAPMAIPLFVTASNYGQYQLKLTELQNIPQLYEIWLMDNFKKDSLDIRNNPTYTFDITTDTGSYGHNRFVLVIRQNQALGVHLLSFNATKATGGSQVVWTTENEQAYTTFTVQRSLNGGASFTDLTSISSTGQGSYNYLDQNPLMGADMYRLKITDLNGNVTFSNIITLMYGNASNIAENNITIYPNPAKSNINLTIKSSSGPTGTVAQAAASGGLTTQLSSIPNTVYNIRIVSSMGIVVQTAKISQQNWQADVSSLMPGTYILQVVNGNNDTLVGAGTFLKL